MKKVFNYIAIAALATTVACGTGDAEKEKARLDSLRQDSIKTAAQAELDKMAMEAHMADSMKMVMEAHVADSIKAAQAQASTTTKKSTTTKTTSTTPTTNRPGATSTTTKTETSVKTRPGAVKK